jgi:hypothetical protein
VALSSTQPSVSPLMFSGKITSEANLPPSSMHGVDGVHIHLGMLGHGLESSVTLKTSCITNCMSRRGGV